MALRLSLALLDHISVAVCVQAIPCVRLGAHDCATKYIYSPHLFTNINTTSSSDSYSTFHPHAAGDSLSSMAPKCRAQC